MALSINTERIASELDSVQQMNTGRLMTGWFSQMDGDVLRLLEAYPQLREAHSAFSQARRGIRQHALSDETWSEMRRAARELAAALRELGNVDVLLCERPTLDGECGDALVNSACVRTWHTA